jgi:hypothetical protein
MSRVRKSLSLCLFSSLSSLWYTLCLKYFSFQFSSWGVAGGGCAGEWGYSENKESGKDRNRSGDTTITNKMHEVWPAGVKKKGKKKRCVRDETAFHSFNILWGLRSSPCFFLTRRRQKTEYEKIGGRKQNMMEPRQRQENDNDKKTSMNEFSERKKKRRTSSYCPANDGWNNGCCRIYQT